MRGYVAEGAVGHFGSLLRSKQWVLLLGAHIWGCCTDVKGKVKVSGSGLGS